MRPASWISSRQPDLVKNADGPLDLYCSPKLAQGHEDNSLVTVPGRAWFRLLRLYWAIGVCPGDPTGSKSVTSQALW